MLLVTILVMFIKKVVINEIKTLTKYAFDC